MQSSQPIRVVSILDTALDVDAMGPRWSEYLAHRDEAHRVKQVPGKQLTWFVIRRIPTSVFLRYVDVAPSEEAKYLQAFEVGVEQIEHAPGETGPISGAHTIDTNGGPLKVWSPEQVDAMPPSWVKEIGQVAYAHSFLAGANGGTYQPPRSLALALVAQRVSHNVAQLKAEARSKADQDRPPSESVSDSGEATAATATEPATESSTPAPTGEPPPT